MQIFQTIAELRQALAGIRKNNAIIGLVPTMGNLHDGHLTLVKRAMQDCDFVIVSIFVNPTQFGQGEDLARYPRTFEADKSSLTALDCDAIFYPSVEEIYPQGPNLDTRVSVPELSQKLCGASRPGHFDGVCTVVAKLLNICMPEKAYFGEKDFQQLTIIRKMCADLNILTDIVNVPTYRAATGLALSSRNNYLAASQQQQAAVLYAALQQTATTLQQNPTAGFRELEQAAIQQITAAGMQVDYFRICNPLSLDNAKPGDRQLRLLTAASLGNTRLIDNIGLDLKD